MGLLGLGPDAAAGAQQVVATGGGLRPQLAGAERRHCFGQRGARRVEEEVEVHCTLLTG